MRNSKCTRRQETTSAVRARKVIVRAGLAPKRSARRCSDRTSQPSTAAQRCRMWGPSLTRRYRAVCCRPTGQIVSAVSPDRSPADGQLAAVFSATNSGQDKQMVPAAILGYVTVRAHSGRIASRPRPDRFREDKLAILSLSAKWAIFRPSGFLSTVDAYAVGVDRVGSGCCRGRRLAVDRPHVRA